MAQCVSCRQEMTIAPSCTQSAYWINDEATPRYEHLGDGDERCVRCGVLPGGFHHPGCEIE